jgi:hypothetical protein
MTSVSMYHELTIKLSPRFMTQSAFLDLLIRLLKSHYQLLVNVGLEIIKQHALKTRRAGMYAVERHETVLELCNKKGSVAEHRKTQTIHFLQDNIVIYQDTAWGDGEIFADYQCSPGYPVDTYREGNRYRVLISLRKTMNQNDIEQFHFKRTIRDGFTQSTEEFQTEVNHFTDWLTISVIFPKTRLPIEVLLLKRNEATTMELTDDNKEILADGRHKYIWTTHHPKRFEAYIMRWRW